MASRSSSTLLYRLCTQQHRLLTQSRRFASTSSSAERPLYPSVEVLLHLHNLSASDIKATGPGGRLLKGDVLAHLGSINASYAKEQAQRISKLSHLDLSNITPATPKPEKAAEAPAIEDDQLEEVYEISLPIDLKPILQLQQRLQNTLGYSPSLSELITRAINLANVDLPATSRQPTADELFDEILGRPSHKLRLSDGQFIPTINQAQLPSESAKPVDVLDELIAPGKARKTPTPRNVSISREGTINDFSLVASKENELRASVMLQRMKSVLEVEPGRLVL